MQAFWLQRLAKVRGSTKAVRASFSQTVATKKIGRIFQEQLPRLGSMSPLEILTEGIDVFDLERDSPNFNTQHKETTAVAQTSSPPAIYHNTITSLHQFWLQQLQRKADNAASSFSIFDAEKNILQKLFDSPDPHKASILQFCCSLFSKIQSHLTLPKDSIDHSAFDGVKTQIAQIIFLADHDLIGTSQLLNIYDPDSSLVAVQTAFEKALQINLNRVKKHQVRHSQAPLQDGAVAENVYKPIVIASMLVTSAGIMNLGLIDIIEKRFFHMHEGLHQHEKELIHTLDIIKNNPEIQQQLNRDFKPVNPNVASNDIIRVSLKLPHNVLPTKQHAKIAALAAMLSDMRQGDVGSCFASCVSIWMMGAMKSKVLADFIHILENGKLSRPSSTDQVDFFPVLDIADSSMQSLIEIDRKGKIQPAKGYIWAAPGLFAACRQIGIPAAEINKTFLDVLAKRFCLQKEPTAFIKVTVEELIDSLIETNDHDNSLNAQQITDLRKLALFTYSSETNPPLLRAWESCLAAMAESKNDSHIRQKIRHCVTLTLDSQWPNHLFTGLTNEAKKIQKVFYKVLDAGIQLRYDELTPFKVPDNGDGHSKTSGAFILHELSHASRSASAKRIQTPDEFRSFILNRLKVTREIFDRIAPPGERPKYQQVIKKIRDFINHSDSDYASFLKNVIRNYHSANKDLIDPLANWKQLEHLPFQDATGDVIAPVYNKATGLILESPEIVRPKNAEQLLAAFIDFARNHTASNQESKNVPISQRYLAATPQHAFTLTPADPSLCDALKSHLSAQAWIQQFLLAPGKTIANLPLSSEQKEIFINESAKLLLPAELCQAFKAAALSFTPSEDSVHAFSNQLLDLVLSFKSKSNPEVRSACSTTLTNIYLQNVISQSAAKILQQTIVRIADTNWIDQGARHIYFACFSDPVSNTLQLASVNEEGNELQALDQNEWVAYVPWEMYGVKLNPALSHHHISNEPSHK